MSQDFVISTYDKFDSVKKLFLNNIAQTFDTVQIFGGAIRDLISELKFDNNCDLDIISPNLIKIFETMATCKTSNKQYHAWKDSLKNLSIKLTKIVENKGSKYCKKTCCSEIKFKHYSFSFEHNNINYPIDIINHWCGSNDFLCNSLSIINQKNTDSFDYKLEWRNQEGFTIYDAIEDCKNNVARLVAPLSTVYKHLDLYIKRTNNMIDKKYKYIGPTLTEDFTEFSKYYLNNSNPITVKEFIKETKLLQSSNNFEFEPEFDKLYEIPEIQDKLLKITILNTRKYVSLAKLQVEKIKKLKKEIKKNQK